MELGAGALADALRDLWPVLAGLTVFDGVTWIGRRGLLASSLLGGPLRLRGPGLRWAGLSPLDRVYSLAPEAVLLGPQQAHFLVAGEVGGARRFRPDHYRSFLYPQLAELEHRLDPAAGRLTLPDGSPFAVPSVAAGRALLGRIVRVRESAGGPGRDARERLDETELPRRRAALGTLSTVLKACAATAFGWSLLVVPLVVYKSGAPVRLALPLAAGFLALHAATATAGVLMARRLRHAGRTTPRGALLGVLFYPPATLRAATALNRELAVDLDPLAVLAAEAAAEELAGPLRAELHGIEQALAAPAGDADWRAAWTHRRVALYALLERLGNPRAALLAAPEREDPAASHYCPFCGSEFLVEAKECAGCLGNLVAFDYATGKKQSGSRRSRPKL